jgi:hypothetical protein
MDVERTSAPRGVPSLFWRVSSSLALAVALTLLGALLQRALWRQGISGIAAYLDDLLVGVLAGLLVFIYEHRRSRDLRERLATISAMNEHIRSALREIACLALPEVQQIQTIRKSVSRIEWALREIIPAEEEAKSWKGLGFLDPTEVICPICGATKGSPCNSTTTFHRERIEAAHLVIHDGATEE